MRRSREGRHTATASTWLLRYGMAKNREEAVKLVKRGKVKIGGITAQTRIGYRKVTKDIIRIDDATSLSELTPPTNGVIW